MPRRLGMFLRKRDITILWVCMLLMLALGLALYFDWGRIEGHASLPPIGELVEADSGVERKFARQVIWNRVQAGARLFDRDTILTGARGGARLRLLEKIQVQLQPETMVVLRVQDQQPELQMPRGTIRVFRGDGEGASCILVAGKTRLILQGATGSFRRTEDGLEVSVTEGQVTIETPAGTRVLEGPGGMRLDLNDPIGDLRVEREPFHPLAPDQDRTLDARDIGDLRGATIAFDWNDEDEPGQLQIATDVAFGLLERIAPTPGAVSLTPGTYYWRVVGKQRVSFTRKLRIVESGFPPEGLFAVVLPNPGRYQTEDGDGGASRRLYNFSWRPVADAVSYVLEVTSSGDFERPFVQQAGKTTARSLLLPRDTYNWRVRAVEPGGRERLSSVLSVKDVTQIAAEAGQGSGDLDVPTLLLPVPGTTLVPGATMPVRWRPVAGAGYYHLGLYSREGVLLREAISRSNELSMDGAPRSCFCLLVVTAMPANPARAKGRFAQNVLFAEVNETPDSGLPVDAAADVVAATEALPAEEYMRFPKPNAIVDLSRRDDIPFRWRDFPGAKSYTLRLSTAEGRALYEREGLPKNEYVLRDLSKLYEGEFELGVESENARMNTRFQIVLEDEGEFDIEIER